MSQLVPSRILGKRKVSHFSCRSFLFGHFEFTNVEIGEHMNNRHVPILSVALVFVVLVVVACNGLSSKPSNTAPGKSTTSAKSNEDALKKSPKDSIAYQFQLVKEGNVEKLKDCVTERLRDRVTPETVEKGQAQSANYTLDDLVASVEMAEDAGQKTAKIMMKNGRTLTTLIETDGKWLADSVWFK